MLCWSARDQCAAGLSCGSDDRPRIPLDSDVSGPELPTVDIQDAWAMQLSMRGNDGAVCSFVAAAWGGLGPYDCEVDGSKMPTDCRYPVQAVPYWTAKCQDEKTDASPFNNWTVARVWF